MAHARLFAAAALAALIAGCQAIPRDQTVAQYCAAENHQNDGVCRLKVEIDGQSVALYNLHMFQPWPARSMAARRAQLAGLFQRLDRETLPCIIAGDFNATPTSPTMAALAERNLADAWDQAGWGLGATWPDRFMVRRFPGIRIDHVYMSSSLTCTACTVGKGKGSDHRPIVAQLGFAK